MMYTIYVRKENEEVLASIKNKSEFFNALLAKERFGNEGSHEAVGRLQDEIVKRKTSDKPYPTKLTAPLLDNLEFKPCKHGSDPKFCKHAKLINGKKVCK